MVFRPEHIGVRSLRLGIVPDVGEVFPIIRALGDIRLEHMGVDLIELGAADVAEHRLPVLLGLEAPLLHERVAPLPILRTDEKIDIPEGAQLRDRIIIPHHIALEEQVVNSLIGERLRQLLHGLAALGEQRHRLQALAAHGLREGRAVLMRPAHDRVAENAGD